VSWIRCGIAQACHEWHGRHRGTGRTRNPIIRIFYQRLLAVGKPKKLTLVACMRKLLTILNTMVRTHQRWSADHISVTLISA